MRTNALLHCDDGIRQNEEERECERGRERIETREQKEGFEVHEWEKEKEKKKKAFRRVMIERKS